MYTLLILDEKYSIDSIESRYKIQMKLTIKSVSSSDYGSYICVSKNSFGDTDGTVQLYCK